MWVIDDGNVGGGRRYRRRRIKMIICPYSGDSSVGSTWIYPSIGPLRAEDSRRGPYTSLRGRGRNVAQLLKSTRPPMRGRQFLGRYDKPVRTVPQLPDGTWSACLFSLLACPRS